MPDDIYYKLREKVDQYGVGFAATESGVEIKILKKLFTEEEAEMYMNLSEDLQTSEDIAKKINRDPAEVEQILQRMTEKGHTFPRFPKKEGEPFYYAAAPYAHGILEHQVISMDEELAELLEEHFIAGPITRPEVSLRTIPVNTAVDETVSVASYDDAKSVIRTKNRIALTNCVCNEWQSHRGSTCEKPKEVCMLFDFYGEYYVDRGMGRWITQDEAIKKLEECDKAGLVAQFSGTENPEALCNCCPDCCGTLRAFKRLPAPALVAATNYFCKVDPDLCTACEACIDRCSMDAITMGQEDVVEINLERCIGCGLCVSTCPEEALGLIQKPEDQRFVPALKGNFMRPSKEFEDMIKSGSSPA